MFYEIDLADIEGHNEKYGVSDKTVKFVDELDDITPFVIDGTAIAITKYIEDTALLAILRSPND